ncbi:hypothetical protein OAV58_03100 [Gammaproteobacteria bacterium]|jgi:hypothetical protein|nr:hypothetical protein [Gammaproteobacteria bacterium]MDC3302112.1 hypothetical protein [Gammaproteobacteria bacterium]
MFSKNNIVGFILTNIVIYLFAMGVWSFWSYFAFVDLEQMDWQGSIIYLPHGIRVLGICFFGYKSLPALLAAEMTGPLFINPEQYMGTWSLASIGSIGSVIFARYLADWSQANIPGAIMSPLNSNNYRKIVLVIFISGLLNAILANTIITLLEPSITLDPLVILRFFIGDVLGACIVILFLSVAFTSLRANRLYSPLK